MRGDSERGRVLKVEECVVGMGRLGRLRLFMSIPKIGNQTTKVAAKEPPDAVIHYQGQERQVTKQTVTPGQIIKEE